MLKDLEDGINNRAKQLASLQRNYEGLHNICEELHEEIDRLRARDVPDPEELQRLRQDAKRLATVAIAVAPLSWACRVAKRPLLRRTSANLYRGERVAGRAGVKAWGAEADGYSTERVQCH